MPRFAGPAGSRGFWSGSRRWSLALEADLSPVRIAHLLLLGVAGTALEAVLDTAVIALFSIAIRAYRPAPAAPGADPSGTRGHAADLRVLQADAERRYVEPLEGFIRDHSEAAFSHTFCAECGEKHYADYLGA